MKAGRATVTTAIKRPDRTLAAVTGDRKAQMSMAKSIAKKVRKPDSGKQPAPFKTVTRPVAAAQGSVTTGSSLSSKTTQAEGVATGIIEIYPTGGTFPGYSGPASGFMVSRFVLEPLSAFFDTFAGIGNSYTEYEFSYVDVSFVTAVSANLAGTLYFAIDSDAPLSTTFAEIDNPIKCAEPKRRFETSVRLGYNQGYGLGVSKKMLRKGEVTALADEKNFYSASCMLALAGFSGTVNDKVGDLRFQVHYKLRNIVSTAPLDNSNFDFDTTAGTSSLIQFLQRPLSSVSLRWVRGKDGVSLYWNGPQTTVDLTGTVSTPGLVLAGNLLEITRLGVIVAPDRIDRLAFTSTDLVNLDTIFIDAVFTLKYGDRLALSGPAPAGAWAAVTLSRSKALAVPSPF